MRIRLEYIQINNNCRNRINHSKDEEQAYSTNYKRTNEYTQLILKIRKKEGREVVEFVG